MSLYLTELTLKHEKCNYEVPDPESKKVKD